MRPPATDVVWFVCLLDTMMSCAKMDKPIKVPFGLSTQMGPRNHELGGGRISQGKGQN